MYFDKAIERINNIEWGKAEETIDKDTQHLGYEFLRRMAKFINEQKISQASPLIINAAEVLGDVTEIEYMEYCSTEVQEALKNEWVEQNMIKFYLQLAAYVDKNKNVEVYLQIYEPMIRLLELGFHYGYREAGLMIYNLYFYPLGGWYDRFLSAQPIH